VINPKEGMMDVQKAWTRLLSVQELSFEAQSRTAPNTGWNGSGKGTVRVEKIDAGVILFHERGTWAPKEGRETIFTNVFRWTTDPDARFIRLEHLRFGEAHPVYLFDLVPVDEWVLESSEPHVCSEDLYAARMEFDEQNIHLKWTINGPKKSETISYTYRSCSFGGALFSANSPCHFLDHLAL
jgi:hypothetical protein